MSVARFTALSSAVFAGQDDPVVVDDSQIADLVRAAKASPTGRARLLLHSGAEDSLHEMIIALPADSCDHPHINFKSGKSFLALSGRFAVMHCSEDGSEIRAIVLSAGEGTGARIARLQAPAWHTIIPLSGDVVFLETIIGPFTGNRFAEWFPSAGVDGHQQAVTKMRQIAHDAAQASSR